MSKGSLGLKFELDPLQALRLKRESCGDCKCTGQGLRVYYEDEGEKPSEICEECGGKLNIIKVVYESNWRGI
jgi:hypothetical protein